MARRRKKDREVDIEPDLTPETVDVRHQGPWDSTEKSDDEGRYIDLGSLLIRGDEGFSLQLPADNDEGDIGSVVLVAEGSALELRAFAASRSGGLWEEIRADIATEVARLGGESTEADGPYGAELTVSVPAETAEGESGMQASRIIGIDGPRWMLRATLLGEAALTEDAALMAALRDVIVARGAEPRIQREPLLLTIPPHAVAAPDED